MAAYYADRRRPFEARAGLDRRSGSSDMGTAATVLTSTVGGVRTLTLHNPEGRNARNLDMERACFEALDAADADADSGVRVVVITGSGTSFCPGADTTRLEDTASAGLDLGWRHPQTYALRG